MTNALFLKHAQVVYEDRPFQMIHFVLNTDSQQPVAFQFKKVAFEILSLNLYFCRASDLVVNAGQRLAALFPRLSLLTGLNQLRID